VNLSRMRDYLLKRRTGDSLGRHTRFSSENSERMIRKSFSPGGIVGSISANA
jgi:hypothetical protein